MSGGHWEYRDQTITDELNPRDLPKILEALRRCFHEVDWVVSGDTSQEHAARRVFEVIKELGDELFA